MNIVTRCVVGSSDDMESSREPKLAQNHPGVLQIAHIYKSDKVLYEKIAKLWTNEMMKAKMSK